MGKGLLIILIIVGSIFILSLSSDKPSSPISAQPTPVVEQRNCLLDSDIDKQTKYTCGSGPNSGVLYYRVMKDVTINKKVLRQGEWDTEVPLPDSCRDLGIGNVLSNVADREVRPSRRCTDNEMYEVWCGDYCTRFIEEMVRGKDFRSIPLCGMDPNDGYLGCFNQAFLFKLNDPPFNPSGANKFDVYIRSDETIPDRCRDILQEYEKASQRLGIPLSPLIRATFQCWRDLETTIKCPQ